MILILIIPNLINHTYKCSIYPIYHYSWLAFCLFCALSPLVKISLWANLVVAVAFYMYLMGLNHALSLLIAT